MNNKVQIPQVGLGLWHMRDEAECKAAVKTALDLGYTHFDTAQVYGNEAFLGEALKEAGAKRKDLFITTKIWNDNFWWDDIEPSLDESLEKLKTNYVDLLLLHFPVTETRGPAWRRMQDIYQSGKAKAIGVSNYTVRHLEELMATSGVVPAVNQIELHVYLQQPELLDFCKQHDIVVEAYSPLAHGYGLDNAALRTVAKKHSKSTAQIMLRWCIQQDTVVLPKSVTPERIKQNLELFDFELDGDDMQQLASLEQNLHTSWDPTHVQ